MARMAKAARFVLAPPLWLGLVGNFVTWAVGSLHAPTQWP